MAAEQEQVLSTPVPAAKPHVDVTGSGADDTVFSPGIVTPNHTISSLFRNISNTNSVAQQGRKGNSKLGKSVGAEQEQEQSPAAIAKQKGCWFKIRKVAMGK